MRCIEISPDAAFPAALQINRNMRCIEIFYAIGNGVRNLWLIETWDVLKLADSGVLSHWPGRLIETWDVLKLRCWFSVCNVSQRLIETWDVLKWL